MMCPFCGSPMGWESDNMGSEVGKPIIDAEGNAYDEEDAEGHKFDLVVSNYICQHCGATAEITECMHELRNEYPYYQNG